MSPLVMVNVVQLLTLSPSTSHGWTGDAGHMGNVPVASFDPLFFLHHWLVPLTIIRITLEPSLRDSLAAISIASLRFGKL